MSGYGLEVGRLADEGSVRRESRVEGEVHTALEVFLVDCAEKSHVAAVGRGICDQPLQRQKGRGHRAFGVTCSAPV